jgi:AcrR family transcriptional regulator
MRQVDQRRVGRPSRPVLDRHRIAEAALTLIDETGDFTLPELARRLGVQTPSLYHHVDGSAGVVELLRERIGQGMDPSQLEQRPWDVALGAFFRSYRDAFAAHPRVVPFLTTTAVRSPQVLAAYDQMVVLLVQVGVPSAQAMAFLTACENFVIGSALDLAAPDVMWEIPEDVDAPHLASALTSQSNPEHRADNAFEFGLSTLLASIKARSGQRRPGWPRLDPGQEPE